MENKSKFGCSQDSLVRTAILIWGYCKARIVRMSNYKSKYTPDGCDEEIALANSVLLLPDNAARQAVHEEIRINMVAVATHGRNLFMDLKDFVRDAWGPELFKTKMNAAGWGTYYRSASQNNWSAMQGLLASAVNFVTANEAVLRSQGYMNDAYVADLVETKASFEGLFSDFVAAEQASQEGTDARMALCNEIYDRVNGCCADGQSVFRNDGSIKDEFVFSAVLALVEPSGPAGLKGYAIYEINGEPVIGLTAEIESINKRVVVDQYGFYDFGPMSGGATYTVKYVLGDEVKDTETVTIPVGTVVHRDVEIL